MRAKFMTSRIESELEEALGDPRRATAQTVEFECLATELREIGIETPQPRISHARREELRLAVLAQCAANRRGTPGARIRGATMGIAAVAGAGLVVASAASGSNPASIVVEAARDIPRIAQHSAPPAIPTIEGEVVSTRDNGRTLEVRSGTDTVVVQSPSKSRDVTAIGTPVAAAEIRGGDVVRVTPKRESDTGVITAKRIEVLPVAVAPDKSLVAPPDSVTETASEPTADTRPTIANVTPTPTSDATVPARSPTATPKANVSDVAPGATSIVRGNPQPTATATTSPTPVPTKSPTARPKPTGVSDSNPASDSNTETNFDK
jgi:hypothetical protein